MAGKEALIRLSKACKALELEFGNLKIGKIDNETLQTLREMVQKYDKHKRALDIFKRLNGEHLPVYLGIGIISQEEYELLEELMKSEEDK